MAYDEELADRIRALLGDRAGHVLGDGEAHAVVRDVVRVEVARLGG